MTAFRTSADARQSGFSVAAVIPARNAEATIGRALESAESQTLRPDEVVVVDDGSADHTGDAASSRLPRCQIVRTAGVGVAAARNEGIRRAQTEWIGFLDADDYWDTEFLATVAAALARSAEAVACFAGATAIDDSGRTVSHHTMEEGPVSLADVVSGRIVPTTSATVARRSALLACDGFYEGFERGSGVEDLDLWFRLLADWPCIGVARRLATYVVHDERDRLRQRDDLRALERDREQVIQRLAASRPAAPLLRRGRAIMRARTARYWLRAGYPAEGRRAAIASLRAGLTLEGAVTLAAAALPSPIREALRPLWRVWRSR